MKLYFKYGKTLIPKDSLIECRCSNEDSTADEHYAKMQYFFIFQNILKIADNCG